MRKISYLIVTAILLVSILCVGVMPAYAASVGETTYTPGDVNNDTVVNMFDLGVLQRYLNGWGNEIHPYAADVTGDGNVNMMDMGVLQRYLNGWDVTLLPGLEPEPPAPSVELPAIGYDLDGKGRIVISDSQLMDDTTASLTFRNISKDNGREWIIPETSKATYACYDAEGNQLSTGTIVIGALEYRDSVTRTVNLPVGTVRMAITGHNLEYWTPWA